MFRSPDGDYSNGWLFKLVYYGVVILLCATIAGILALPFLPFFGRKNWHKAMWAGSLSLLVIVTVSASYLAYNQKVSVDIGVEMDKYANANRGRIHPKSGKTMQDIFQYWQGRMWDNQYSSRQTQRAFVDKFKEEVELYSEKSIPLFQADQERWQREERERIRSLPEATRRLYTKPNGYTDQPAEIPDDSAFDLGPGDIK